MSQGRFTDLPFHFNPKCVWFSILVVLAYWLVADNPNPLLVPVIGGGAYIAMGWYDHRYNCDSLLVGAGHTALFKPAPTTLKHMPKHDIKVPLADDQEAAYMTQVYRFHVIVIAPLLIYVGFRGVNSDTRIFGVILAIGLLALVYHAGRLFVPRKQGT